MNNYKVITFDAKYANDFAELNKEWIKKFFVVEPMDTYQLDNCEETIISKGGEIFFILEGDKAVGTCAMLPYSVPPYVNGDTYELAKMAVAPGTQGKGYGNILMEVAIAWAKEKNAAQVILHSNTSLTPAITLYKKHGFETVFLGQHPDYDRANIEMKLVLKTTP